MLDSVHEGSNDGSTAINPRPLEKDFSFFSTFCHVGSVRIEGRRLLQILWESMAAQCGIDGWANPALSVWSCLSFLGFEAIVFYVCLFVF